MKQTVTKRQIVKDWKPAMVDLGFVYRDNMFQLRETIDECIHFAISLQRNLHSDSYLVHASVLIKSPFVENGPRQVLIHGKLRPEGIRLHVNRDSWWPPESLPTALAHLRRLAIPWFRHVSQPESLSGALEASIRERKSLIEILEPLSAEEEKALAQVWPRLRDPSRRVAPIAFYHAAILHYLAGNRSLAITRTKDWLATIGPGDQTEAAEAQTQIRLLGNRAN